MAEGIIITLRRHCSVSTLFKPSRGLSGHGGQGCDPWAGQLPGWHSASRSDLWGGDRQMIHSSQACGCTGHLRRAHLTCLASGRDEWVGLGRGKDGREGWAGTLPWQALKHTLWFWKWVSRIGRVKWKCEKKKKKSQQHNNQKAPHFGYLESTECKNPALSSAFLQRSF